MHPILRNVLAILAGIAIGSIVNSIFINISGYIIPPPEGTDVTTYDGLKAAMPFFEPKHFIFPYLAHAFGTLAGSVVAVLIAPEKKMYFSLAIGFFFFLGGFAGVIMLPSPLWFTILDLVGAYFPMSFLAGKIIIGREQN
jgi:hypothetical protein